MSRIFLLVQNCSSYKAMLLHVGAMLLHVGAMLLHMIFDAPQTLSAVSATNMIYGHLKMPTRNCAITIGHLICSKKKSSSKGTQNSKANSTHKMHIYCQFLSKAKENCGTQLLVITIDQALASSPA